MIIFYKKNELSQKFAQVANGNYIVQSAERTLEAGVRQQLIQLNTRYRSIILNKKSEERAFSGFTSVLYDYEQGVVDLSDVLSVNSIASESYFEHIASLFLFRFSFVSLLGDVGLLDYYDNQKVSDELFEELNSAYRQNGFTLPSPVR